MTVDYLIDKTSTEKIDFFNSWLLFAKSYRLIYPQGVVKKAICAANMCILLCATCPNPIFKKDFDKSVFCSNIFLLDPSGTHLKMHRLNPLVLTCPEFPVLLNCSHQDDLTQQLWSLQSSPFAQVLETFLATNGSSFRYHPQIL